MFTINYYWIFKTLFFIVGGIFIIWFASLVGRTIVENENRKYVIKVLNGNIKRRKVLFLIIIESFGSSLFGSVIIGTALSFYRFIDVSIVSFVLAFPSMVSASYKRLLKLIEEEILIRKKDKEYKDYLDREINKVKGN